MSARLQIITPLPVRAVDHLRAKQVDLFSILNILRI